MFRLIKIYLLQVKYSIKASSQYKLDFYSGLFANFFTYFLFYITLYILTYSFESIDGWNYKDLVLLAALDYLSYGVAASLFFNYAYLNEMNINNGNLDRLLTRPINPIISMFFDGFTWTGLTQILVSGIFLFYAVCSSGIRWSVIKLIVLISSVIGGVLIQCGVLIIIGSLSFWVKKSWSLTFICYFNFRDFIRYPLSIYGKILSTVLTFVLPYAFINYYPAVFLLDKECSGYYHLFTPIIGALVFVIAIVITKIGVNNYESVGN
ncbi:MAG: ABC transporter permease [Floccifex sp.]